MVTEWVNPDSGANVSYTPFDPFATPEPLPENELEKNEFVNSLIEQYRAGTLKEEDIRTELEKFYKDAADPEGSVNTAMAYIREKLGLQEENPTESPEPLATEEITEFPQEQSSGGGAGWIIALVLLAAAGGGYYWYAQTQRKRQAAQRMAKQKVSQQNKANASREGVKPSQPASAQNAAKVRTGNYTGGAGSAKPKATPAAPTGTKTSGKPYSAGSANPYGRYTTSDTEEESSYTASFKPNAGRETPRRNRNSQQPAKKDNPEKEDFSDKPEA
jgi:hypothetical protein